MKEDSWGDFFGSALLILCGWTLRHSTWYSTVRCGVQCP